MTAQRIVWLHPKLDKPMGGANFVLYAARQLKQVADVLVVTQRTAPPMQARFEAFGIELRSLDSPTFTDKRFWLSYQHCINRDARAISELIGPRDVVLSSMYPMNVIARRAGHHDIQVLYEAFSLFHDAEYIRNFGPGAALFLALMRHLHVDEEIAATRAAGCRLTLSSSEAQRIKAVYDADAAVVFEGVDTETFNVSVPRNTKFGDRKYILHSTGFDRYKGTDLVIEAMPEIIRQVEDAILVVTYTRENSTALGRYRRDLEKAGIADRVIFLGTLPYDDLPGLNRGATLYVEPGWDRSMSLSVKEAMACGTPVVRGMAGWEEIDDGVEGFLVAPDDIDSYIKRVVELLTDDALRQEMANAAVQRIAKQFTWIAVGNRIAEHANRTVVQLREAV
jgi:glycosyltransferase involved in cell wall biosynthesis